MGARLRVAIAVAALLCLAGCASRHVVARPGPNTFQTIVIDGQRYAVAPAGDVTFQQPNNVIIGSSTYFTPFPLSHYPAGSEVVSAVQGGGRYGRPYLWTGQQLVPLAPP